MGRLKLLLNRVKKRWKLLVLYIPGALFILVSAYTLVIYLSWVSDEGAALEKLARYKKLIDRTEELREGTVYSYSDVVPGARVVDIPTRIYDRNGELIGEFFEQKREIIPYSYIPEWIVKGVIASEDRDFYEHTGVNFKGIFRAMLVNISSFSVVQGGSTITQQLSKVLFTDMDRSIKRKIYEFFCAREIERHYDKQDILSMYLNLIYFGNGAYGVESTSKMFFGRSVTGLDEAECAMIVATISSPRIYSPLSNLDSSVKKTRRILNSMVDAGFLKPAAADARYKHFLREWEVEFTKEGKAVSSKIGGFLYSSYRVNRAPFFNEQIRRTLVERFGDDAVKKGGLSVYTTIDAEAQDAARESLRRGISSQRDFHRKKAGKSANTRYAKEELEKASNIEGALVALNPGTGEILSYAGGYDFTAKNQNDHVSQILRQPGSSFKPLVYCAAVEKKAITPSTIILDEKTVFKGGYSPSNYSNTFSGSVTAREALKKSINIPAVKVLELSGYGKVLSYVGGALQLSKTDLEKRFGETLSLALGTYEISPLENAVLHSVIANGGSYIKPYGIRHVKDYNGSIIWNMEEEVVSEMKSIRDKGNIIDEPASAVTVSMLRGVTEEGGTAYYSVRGRKFPFQTAGKTGTSNNYCDAWFIGYTPAIVTAIWIGNKAGAISLGHGRAGGAIAAPVWADYIGRAYREGYPTEFAIPRKGVTRENICGVSGLVARPDGSCSEYTVEQVYYAGTEPGEYCNIHKNDSQELHSTEGSGASAQNHSM